MRVGGILLLVAAAVVFALLVRELWRGLAPRLRRAREREEITRERRETERALAAAPGGSPDRPLVVTSASVVEARATAEPCPMCDQPVYVEDHGVETHASERLRAVRVGCRFCGHGRRVFLRIDEPMLH